MEKRRNRGASRLQFSKEEQMQAVRAGQPERSHLPLLHQGIHAAHAQLHHQAAEANEDENSAVQAALTADDMQEEAFRAAAHAGKAPKRHNARWQQKRAIRQEYAAAKSSRRPANRTAPAPKAAANAVPKAENIKKRLRQTFARHPTAWAVLALAALLLAVMSSLQSCTPLAQSVLESIVAGAFNPAAFTGGTIGSLFVSMQKGVSRGIFSNEAGLGTGSIAHACADTKKPVKQGMFGIFEVFADTIVICTLTAFAVLMSGTPIEYGQAAGAPLTIAAFSTTFGRAGGVIISIGLTLFATSTILSWCLYGTRCAEFLFKSTKVIKPYQIIFCLVIILGAVTELSLVWDIADTLNGFMAIPNLVGLLGLSPIVIKLTREYFNGVRLGESNGK